MSEEIRKDDISEKDVFKYIIDGAKQASEAVKNMNIAISESAKLNKTVLSKGNNLGNAKAIKEVEQAVTAANSAFAQYIKNETFLNKLEATSIRAKLQLENAINAQTKATERATQKEAQLSSTYSIMDKRLKALVSAYREIAIKKDLGWKITDKEATKYERLQKIITQYDSALKNTDATSGRYTRNVGNYASATNNLGFAFQQLTREAPAFANSMQTGFMAISNNLPIFFDEIGRAIKVNKELIAQGQPTKNVFKQIGSAIFSFGTLLSVGVTLLTLYGKELVNTATGAGFLEEQQEALNRAIERGNEFAQETIDILRKRMQWDKITRKEAIKRLEVEIDLARTARNEAKQNAKETLAELKSLSFYEYNREQRLKARLLAQQESARTEETAIRKLKEEIEQLRLEEYQEQKTKKAKKEKNKELETQIDLTQKLIDIDRIYNEALQNRYEFQLSQLERQLNEELKLQTNAAEQRGKTNIERLDEILAQEKAAALNKLELEYELNKENQELGVQNYKDSEKFKQDLIKLDQEYADKRIQIVAEVNAAQEKFDEQDLAFKKKKAQEELEAEKKKQQQRRELLKLTLDYEIKQSEKRIELIDKEIAKANEQYNNLQELAKNGNISAQQSLAEQQKIINEANQKKIKEQKRIERLKLAETGYDIYSSKVEAGDKTPLLSTIKDLTLLNQFINSLPSFDVGTENTGKNGKGIDGKGGFQAILHPNERVMTSEQNSKVGSMTNNDLADLAYKYNTGQLINLQQRDHAGTSWDLIPIQKELKSIKEAIEQKPETNIGIGQITQSLMTIAHETTKGNKTIRKQYRIRRG